MQAQPTGSLHAQNPVTTLRFNQYNGTTDKPFAQCLVLSLTLLRSLLCSAQFEWMNAAKVDVRVYRRLTRELWNAAAAVSSAASSLIWKAYTCLHASLPALLQRHPATALALQGDAGSALSDEFCTWFAAGLAECCGRSAKC